MSAVSNTCWPAQNNKEQHSAQMDEFDLGLGYRNLKQLNTIHTSNFLRTIELQKAYGQIKYMISEMIRVAHVSRERKYGLYYAFYRRLVIYLNKHFNFLTREQPTYNKILTQMRNIYTHSNIIVEDLKEEIEAARFEERKMVDIGKHLLKHLLRYQKKYEGWASRPAKAEIRAAEKASKRFHYLPDDMKGEIMQYLLPTDVLHIMPSFIYNRRLQNTTST